MSKFFKALENAEREREARRAAAAAETPVPTVPPPDASDSETRPQPAAASVAAPPEPPPVMTRPSASRPVPAEPTPVAPEPPAVVIRPSAPARTVPAEAAPVAPEAPAVVISPTASPQPVPVEASPAYGAPIRRMSDGAASHPRAFTGLLEPAPATEQGDLDDHLVSLLAPTSLAAEQYRAIRLHIETLRRERDVRLVAISSPSRGDGKTISAINVAGALAQAPDARVALVEVDVRHPGVAKYLGLSGGRGLSGYLLDSSMALDTVLERPAGVGFAVIAAGPASSMPYELLKSPRLRDLFSALRERFDFVVVDTPPVMPFPDVGIVRDLVDGFILIVRANRTPREMVRDSLYAIGNDRVLGVVFNDAEAMGVEVDDSGWRSYLARPLGGSRAA